MRVAKRGQDFDDAGFDGNDRNIKRATAQVINEHLVWIVTLRIVNQSGSGWFVHNPQHFQTRQFAGVAGGFPLAVIEVGGHGDHGAVDFASEVLFCPLTQASEDHGGNFRRRKLFCTESELDMLTHLSLDAANRRFRKQGGLIERRLTNQQIAGRIQPNDTGQDSLTRFRVLDHSGSAVFNDGDHAVGGP